MNDPMQALQAMLQAGGADAAGFRPTAAITASARRSLRRSDGGTIVLSQAPLRAGAGRVRVDAGTFRRAGRPAR